MEQKLSSSFMHKFWPFCVLHDHRRQKAGPANIIIFHDLHKDYIGSFSSKASKIARLINITWGWTY